VRAEARDPGGEGGKVDARKSAVGHDDDSSDDKQKTK
jgi:hypothetical protein